MQTGVLFKRIFTFYFLTLCLGAVGFSSCVNKRLAPPPDEASSTFLPASESLKVDLFFDATLSMQGFTLTQSSSSYQQTVPLLERAVIEGWRGGEVAFFKFGEDIAPLPGRKFLEAVKSQFYSDAKYNTRTLIERVIDRAEPNHLTIIVTDLFQDNADVNQLSAKLKNKFIAAELAVGVLGIRSQYDGTVYDVGPDNYSFTYKTTEKPPTGRPFYLLAFGSHANIAHYFATLESSGISNFPERHALILSRFITAQPSPFASAKLRTANKISEISSSNVISHNRRAAQVKAFKISRGKTEADFSAGWSYDPLPNVLEYSGVLTPELTSWKGEDNGVTELALVENQAAKSALNVVAKLAPKDGSFNRLDFEAHLKVSQLPVAGIYRYRIVLRPASYALPGWVRDWNMRDSDIKAWHLNPTAFNGARTYNLENFLGTLRGAVMNTSQPEAGEFFLYIRVDR